jgi:hypothetical protein
VSLIDIYRVGVSEARPEVDEQREPREREHAHVVMLAQPHRFREHSKAPVDDVACHDPVAARVLRQATEVNVDVVSVLVWEVAREPFDAGQGLVDLLAARGAVIVSEGAEESENDGAALCSEARQTSDLEFVVDLEALEVLKGEPRIFETLVVCEFVVVVAQQHQVVGIVPFARGDVSVSAR